MNRKFIKCLFMAFAVGLMCTPNTAKAEQLVVMPINAQLPQEDLKPMLINTQQPEGIATDSPVIGISSVGGTFKAMYEENNFIFVEIQNSDNQTQLFYAPNNDEWKSKLNNLKLNMHANVKYALGTPQKSKDKIAMPLSDIDQPVPTLYGNKYSKKVSPNKEWTVYLNKEVNEKNINNSNVYVVDAHGNNVPVKISIAEKNKAIKITPVQSYKSGQTYYLVIENNIYSNFKGLKMQFTITE